MIEAAQANLARHPDDDDEDLAGRLRRVMDWVSGTWRARLVLPLLYLHPLRMRRRGASTYPPAALS